MYLEKYPVLQLMHASTALHLDGASTLGVRAWLAVLYEQSTVLQSGSELKLIRLHVHVEQLLCQPSCIRAAR